MKEIEIINPVPIAGDDGLVRIPKKGSVIKVSEGVYDALIRGKDGKAPKKKVVVPKVEKKIQRPKILNKDLGDKDGLDTETTRLA